MVENNGIPPPPAATTFASNDDTGSGSGGGGGGGFGLFRRRRLSLKKKRDKKKQQQDESGGTINPPSVRFAAGASDKKKKSERAEDEDTMGKGKLVVYHSDEEETTKTEGDRLWMSIKQDMERKKLELQQQQERTQKEKAELLKKRSWLCKTSFFQNMIHSAFQLVDQDNSNDIDEKELYSGLLLIHLKLGTYAGPAACKPISREKCHSVFVKMDVDNSGRLDRDEFENVIMVLFGNVLTRVLLQYVCTLLLVPLIAQYILRGIIGSIYYAYETITTLDEHSAVADNIEVTLETIWSEVCEYVNSILFYPIAMSSIWDDIHNIIPDIVWTYTDKIVDIISSIPNSVWEGIPITLISTILSIMLVPWSLMKVDDIFQSIAAARGRK